MICHLYYVLGYRVRCNEGVCYVLNANRKAKTIDDTSMSPNNHLMKLRPHIHIGLRIACQPASTDKILASLSLIYLLINLYTYELTAFV